MANTFMTFWNSSMHRVCAPKGVHAFYVTDQDGVSPVFRNGGGEDAEDRVMSSVRQLFVRHPHPCLRVCVFQSLSPCGRCSQRYLSLVRESLQHGVQLRLELSFAGLYKMARPSCRRKGCQHRVPATEHHRQLRGLKKLRNFGVALKTLDFADWVALCRYLGLQPISYSAYRGKREAEDLALAQDIKILLGSWTSPSARTPKVEAGVPSPKSWPRAGAASPPSSTFTGLTRTTGTARFPAPGTPGIGQEPRATPAVPSPARRGVGFSSASAEAGVCGERWSSQGQPGFVAVAMLDKDEEPWRRDSSRWRCPDSCLCIGLAALVYAVVVVFIVVFKQL